MKIAKQYLKGIDTLRAIGAISVIIGHIELSKSSLNIPNLINVIPFFKYTSGHLGVILFYVISGFLITYLMLVEKNNNSTINIVNFYFRRILRIWPIYFLILLLLIFIFPKIISLDYYGKINSYLDLKLSTILIYLFLVPNLLVFGFTGIGGGFHLGTIGTEEQFYLIWPLLFKTFKNILIPLVLIFFIITLAPHIIDFINYNYVKDLNYKSSLVKTTTFFNHFKINCMALGGIFSYFYINKKTVLKIFYNKYVQKVAFVSGFGLWILGFHIPYFNDEFYALLFSIIVINLATNPYCIFKFENKFMNFIGKISYGMYIYHWILIYLVIDILNKFQLSIIKYNIVLYTSTFSLTIFISYFSYNYFEKYFLVMKNRYNLSD